ncbi:Low affinity Fe/Cu permease [Rhizobium mongolense subsp. loessense]|uniref:Low affinity Fe/Cu permease n=1 Tax=Rhizobium mongolense subsp. loessense TaxID=158890 RepID=A0A1G4RYP3_9HYPH|nr:Low affinity Fe/Cu permease [Rhizobium mongolense subsp. loessense]
MRTPVAYQLVGRLSDHCARIVGSRLALMGVAAVIAVWVMFGLATGPTKQWLMATNMLGTLATCLILVLLQHSQNRDMRALQTKLEELIRSSGAPNHMIGVERWKGTRTLRLWEGDPGRGPQTNRARTTTAAASKVLGKLESLLRFLFRQTGSALRPPQAAFDAIVPRRSNPLGMIERPGGKPYQFVPVVLEKERRPAVGTESTRCNRRRPVDGWLSGRPNQTRKPRLDKNRERAARCPLAHVAMAIA